MNNSLKPIYPDYDLQYDDYRAGIMSYVRKQNKDGIWYLIPVIERHEFNSIPEKDFDKDREIDKIKRVKELLDLIKRFQLICYRVYLFYIVPEEGKLISSSGRPIGGKLDPDQRSERERLMPHIDGSKPTINMLEEVDGPDFRRNFIKLMECFKQIDESKIYRPSLVLEYVYGTE